jgi:ATP-dependent Clp protease ATP-binding subunit ClpA
MSTSLRRRPALASIGQSVPTGRQATNSGSAQSAFQAAGKLARETRSQLVGAHVVLAIAGMQHGTAIRAVRSLGIDIDALAAAAREEVGERREGRATGAP